MTFYADDYDVLAGGEWVQRGMVWRWQADPDIQPEPEPKSYRPHDLIACPTCLARMDEKCRNNDVARPTRDHEARLVKRVCSCGGSVRPREAMCRLCEVEEMAREMAA